jgi:CBS domain containing-hemolysin-like protein
MYILSPIGYPTAYILDHLLGTYHDRTFSREGLKTLIMLHEVPRFPLNSLDRLHPVEASTICNLLSISTVTMSEIMTPFKSMFTLSSSTHLSEIVRYEISKSGFNMIPVYESGDKERLVGLLNVKYLIGLNFNGRDVAVGELELGELRMLAPKTKLTEALGVFQGVDMMLITEGGRSDGRPLGVVTFRDLMEFAMGGEMAMH